MNKQNEAPTPNPPNPMDAEPDTLMRVAVPADILAVTIREATDGTLTLEQLAMMQVKAGSTAGITDIAGLRRRVAEFIHAYGLNNIVVRPISVSRRFTRSAHGLGLKVQDVLEDLMARGQITWIVRGNKRFIASKPILDQVIKVQIERNGKADMAAYEDGIVANAY